MLRWHIFLEPPNNPREHIFSDNIFWTTHPTLYAYVIYEWPLIDQVNWISMRSFKQSSTPSRISSSIYTPFIIAFMYVMRQNFWQEISHIGTFITEYAQPRFTFWLFRLNHNIDSKFKNHIVSLILTFWSLWVFEATVLPRRYQIFHWKMNSSLLHRGRQRYQRYFLDCCRYCL